jgi:hypothetical protein
MKKHCRQCDTDVRRADYYRHPKSADGLMAICKACHKGNVRDNYLRNREHFREYERGRANLPHRIEAREAYARTPEGRAAQARSTKAWASRNSVKRKAQIACGNAIRDGRLIRQPCDVCGEVKAQAHHDDYGKPLDVRWLCTKHHAEWHRHNTPKAPEQHAA